MKSAVAFCLALGLVASLSGCHDEGDKAVAKDDPSPVASPSHGRVKWSPTDERWGWLSFRTIQPGKPIAMLPVPAKVAPLESQTWSVQAPLEGRVEQVYTRIGQIVKKGDPLLVVRSTGLTDLLREQIIARQSLVLRQETARHAKTLSEAHAIPRRELLNTLQEVHEAEVDLRAANDKLGALNAALMGDSTYMIKAPHDGVVVQAQVNPGEVASPDKPPLLTIAKLDHVVVWAQLLDSDLEGVAVGDMAKVIAPGRSDRQIDARVESISQAVDPEQHTVGIRLVTTRPASWLLPNGFVQVVFSRRQGSAIVIPQESVLTDDLQSIVFVKKPDGTLEKRAVVVGYQANGQAEILSGLRPGDNIVVKGAILLLNEVGS